MEQNLRKIIRQMISESLSEKNVLNEAYTLVVKNDHPNININKKFTIDSAPTTLLGKWDGNKIMKAINNDSNILVSGTSLELINKNGKTVKKGQCMGWNGNIPYIINK